MYGSVMLMIHSRLENPSFTCSQVRQTRRRASLPLARALHWSERLRLALLGACAHVCAQDNDDHD